MSRWLLRFRPLGVISLANNHPVPVSGSRRRGLMREQIRRHRQRADGWSAACLKSWWRWPRPVAHLNWGGGAPMNGSKGLLAAALSLAFFGLHFLLASPVHAQGLVADAHVYELNENARFRFHGANASEASTSQMMGFVDPSTPLCPVHLSAPIPVL